MKGKGLAGTIKGKCQNYGKKGHYVADCWEKDGGKEGQAPKWCKPTKESKENDLAKQTEEADFAFTANDTVLISILASDWLADSAATTHITRNKSDFIDYSDVTSKIEGIMLGATLRTKGTGMVALEYKVNNKIYFITLKEVKHALEAPNNILSIGCLMKNGHSVVFTGIRVDLRVKMVVFLGQDGK